MITPEVEVVPELMTRLSLDAPPEAWAEQALAPIRTRPPDRAAARAKFARSPFNIERSVEVFSRIYASASPG